MSGDEGKRAQEGEDEDEEGEGEDDEGSWRDFIVNLYYAMVNVGITLGSVALIMIAYWLFKFATCTDCCCNSCNRGSSFCAFPRFDGEDIGDPTRNFIFWMGATGFVNFCLSYSIWANVGSPRMFLLFPGLVSVCLLIWYGLKIKWLLCKPVERPSNNLSNWISMNALNTEHGRVAIYSSMAYASILLFDYLVSLLCCCCIEEIEDEEVSGAKQKTD